MTLRDEVEEVLRSWDAYEVNRGKAPVIDFDCHPGSGDIEPAADRIAVHKRLTELRQAAEGARAPWLIQRLDADLACLGAFLGERVPLSGYMRATQGCPAAGWPEDYVTSRGDLARKNLERLGISWGVRTDAEMKELEAPLDIAEVPEAVRQATVDYEPTVRQATGSTTPYELSIESTDLDEYWAYWTDGVGPKVRLRLNLRHARFTQVAARQFALHEVLGHGLQGASYAARSTTDDVPWVRLLSVHAPQQVLLEGLAQAMPLFVAPDDELLIARVRVVHFTQLVRAELHLAINSGASVTDCADHAHARVPWYTDEQISDLLSDRGADPRLRSYLWAYPAGCDWFVNLAEADATTSSKILHAAYRDPLTPGDLSRLWPDGPPIGGTGSTLHLPRP